MIWVLAVVHTLGAGSDRSKLWMQWIVVAPVVPLVYLLVLRLLPSESRRPRVAHRPGPAGVHGGRTHHACRSSAAVRPGVIRRRKRRSLDDYPRARAAR